MTKILVVIDPQEDKPTALERCRALPPESNLDILVTAYIKSEGADKLKSSFERETEHLTKLVTPYIADGYKIATEVIPFKDLYESIIEAADKFEADFVIKPMRQHSLFSTIVRTSTDWNLIRHCQHPLMLVSDLAEIKGRPIIGALDLCSEEERHDKLNDVVMMQASGIGESIGSTCVIVNSYKSVAPIASMDPAPFPTTADARQHHLDAAAEFSAKYGVSDENVFVGDGPAAMVINEAAKATEAGLIVMGTVARQGIEGALIGNTAESVLEGANCDVMIVKLPES